MIKNCLKNTKTELQYDNYKYRKNFHSQELPPIDNNHQLY